MPNKQNRKIMAEEVVLMKGNEAIAHAAIRIGVDGYFGYPITPQSEVLETLAEQKPWETTGMVVLQAESEVAAINMVYGGAGSGKMVMTSSSSPGVSLKQEGISYIAGAELPCLVVNVMRGGPGLGTIQPSQADYFQTTKGGGHGDYHLIALAPASVQEMADFVGLAFDLAFKYRNPAIGLGGRPPAPNVRTDYAGQKAGGYPRIAPDVQEKRFWHNVRGLQPVARDVSPISSPHWSWIRPSWSSATCTCRLNMQKSKKKKHATRNLTQKMLNT